MLIKDIIKRIDRYLKKENASPIIVNAQNKNDLQSISTHYMVQQNIFIAASDATFCHQDELPVIATLMNCLSLENKNFFVQEVSTFYKLQGESALVNGLQELLSMNIAGHVIIITYQCAEQLQKIKKDDPRLENRIYFLDGDLSNKPTLIFTANDIELGNSITSINGINHVASAIEGEYAETIYVKTNKSKNTYPYSLFLISDMKEPYEVLCQKDVTTAVLSESLGTKSDWQYALSEFNEYPSWASLVDAKIGSCKNLDVVIGGYEVNKANKHWLWLYFIGVKLFGAGKNWCLNTAAQNTQSIGMFIRNIYRSILELSPNDENFIECYEQRKAILKSLGNPDAEVMDFCKIVLSKGKEALCYLTDNTMQEKELVFTLLDKYGLEYDRNKLMSILEYVYPDLWAYLKPYHFQNELLDSYFQDYKYQKVINKIFPEFMNVVEQQAINRDYNSILQPRSSVLDYIDKTRAQTYFTDALGVEYLAYIMSKCHDLSMLIKVTVCRCELPSITAYNKDEFYDLFSTEEYPIISVDKIDKIKHHGEEGYDYTKETKKLPIHLIRELEIIDDLLKKIKVNLESGIYDKAILISDHGASRLAVIHETENMWEMKEKGLHSGRCCPKSDVDSKPESATDAGEFWALANYDRFRGSRKSGVEVHGGATLEEITVPVIEITSEPAEIEVILMPLDAPTSFTGIPEISVSYNKPAAIKIYISNRLSDISIEIEGHRYEATTIDNNYHVVESMPEIKRAKMYKVDVYSGDSKIAENLPLLVKKAGFSEKSIL